jgi:hypothetical protein
MHLHKTTKSAFTFIDFAYIIRFSVINLLEEGKMSQSKELLNDIDGDFLPSDMIKQIAALLPLAKDVARFLSVNKFSYSLTPDFNSFWKQTALSGLQDKVQLNNGLVESRNPEDRRGLFLAKEFSEPPRAYARGI